MANNIFRGSRAAECYAKTQAQETGKVYRVQQNNRRFQVEEVVNPDILHIAGAGSRHEGFKLLDLLNSPMADLDMAAAAAAAAEEPGRNTRFLCA